MSTTATAPVTNTYFYVLVLKIQTGGHAMNYALVESRGPVDIPAGTRQSEAFEQVRTQLLDNARKQGMSGNATTELWSLTPETL
ncbi:hypothetical protein [Nocardiopsis sp. MG754419]|uniref:hypothetical protein n=1 Tax=Nocardiopsis sp. MG754419 TaxID=2259865 RepID=UPI001BA90B3D|nr:hypothetical protein [Nocardiopsis sp. MG754419]MBR8745327.1 hypothetical protein [Nocardiopsis sp. MG754419]